AISYGVIIAAGAYVIRVPHADWAPAGWDPTGVTEAPMRTNLNVSANEALKALLQRLAAGRSRLSLCADQGAAASCWWSIPLASVRAEGPMPKAPSTGRTSPRMAGRRHQGRACPLRRARMTSSPLIVA